MRRDLVAPDALNIKEDSNTSCTRSCCCPMCSLAQMHRECVQPAYPIKEEHLEQYGAPSHQAMHKTPSIPKTKKSPDGFYSIE